MTPPMLSLRQVAARLGVSYSKVRLLTISGQLPAVNLVGCWRVEQADLDAFIARQRTSAAAEPVTSSELPRLERNPFL